MSELLKFDYDPTSPVSLPTVESMCIHCRMTTRHPVDKNDLDPISVMQCREENNFLKERILLCKKTVRKLAHECLDAGVKPTVMNEADDMLELIRAVMKKLSIDDKETE